MAASAVHTQSHRGINVDKNAAYPKAIDELKAEKQLPDQAELRQNKYLNNMVEQDHQGIKRLVNLEMVFGSFNTALAFNKGIRNNEHDSLRKGQIEGVEKGAVQKWVNFLAEIFGVAD